MILVMAMEGVVMGCLCVVPKRFPYKKSADDSLHKVSQL